MGAIKKKTSVLKLERWGVITKETEGTEEMTARGVMEKAYRGECGSPKRHAEVDVPIVEASEIYTGSICHCRPFY